MIKSFFTITGLVLLFITIPLSAKTDSTKIAPAYDLDFMTYFLNREFDATEFHDANTFFGARFTPGIGISIKHDKQVGKKQSFNHRFMVGYDMRKNFGTAQALEDNMLKGLHLYYTMDTQLGDKTKLTLVAGAFPRKHMQGKYSEAFFSDSLKVFDNTIEGLLVKVARPKAKYELGLDWIGRYGQDTREKFVLYSSGNGYVSPWLYLGYTAYMHHYSSSKSVKGVVDNILVNPNIGFDLSSFTALDKFDINLGWLQAAQHDRKMIGSYVFPGGGEFTINLSKWRFGVSNYLYYGKGLMPYYNFVDAGGNKYGNGLYLGNAFYRIKPDSSAGLYDRVDVYYSPRLGKYVSIDMRIILHFNQGWAGTQQFITVRINLEK